MADQQHIKELAEELVMSYPPEAIVMASKMVRDNQPLALAGEWDEYLDAHYRHEEATCH